MRPNEAHPFFASAFGPLDEIVPIEASLTWTGRNYQELADFLGPEMYSHVDYSYRSGDPQQLSTARLCTLQGILVIAPGARLDRNTRGLLSVGRAEPRRFKYPVC